MPFKSKSQQRWMFANKPEMAKRWADHTPDIKSLPEHVDKKAMCRRAMVELLKEAMVEQYASGNIKAGRGFAKLAYLLSKGDPITKSAAAVAGKDNAVKLARYFARKLVEKLSAAKKADDEKRAYGGSDELQQLLQMLGGGQSQIPAVNDMRRVGRMAIPEGMQDTGSRFRGELEDLGAWGTTPMDQSSMAPLNAAMLGLGGAGMGGLMGFGMGAARGQPMQGAGRGLIRGGMAGIGAGLGNSMGSALTNMAGGSPQAQSLGGLAGLLGGGIGGYALGGHLLGPAEQDQQIDSSMML